MLRRVAFAGDDVVFNILTVLIANFQRLAIRADYLEEVEQFRTKYRTDCVRSRIDYVPLHTGMPFDKALMSYLLTRQARA